MSVDTPGGLLRERGCFGQFDCFETVGMPIFFRGCLGQLACFETDGIALGTVSSGSGDGGLEEAKLGGGLCLGLWSSELELCGRALRGEGVSNLCSAGLL